MPNAIGGIDSFQLFFLQVHSEEAYLLPRSMKAKRIFLSSLLALAFCLTGCSVKIVNTTPAIAPASPTGNYTLSAQAAGQKEDRRPEQPRGLRRDRRRARRAMTAPTTAQAVL